MYLALNPPTVRSTPYHPLNRRNLTPFQRKIWTWDEYDHLHKSPMSSPVFFIKKTDSSLRLVQDYRALNAVTIKKKYLLLLISELINKLQGAKYFTKLDVCWGFNNVQMKIRDKWKATFQTNRGLMDGIFDDLISEGMVVVYLDNILIFTKTLEEHQDIV